MYIAPDPASHSHVLYMTNIQENKLHLIKSRFKQLCLKIFLSTNLHWNTHGISTVERNMCLKTFFKALIDLQ